VKIRFYLNDRAERVMALWSESRGEYLVADSVFAEVDACICGETGSCGEEIKRIAAFLDNTAAKAVDPEWTIDTALPCSPSKLVCLGKSYADHAKEFDGDSVQEPAVFLKSPSAITSCRAGNTLFKAVFPKKIRIWEHGRKNGSVPLA
jgi:2,4-didehydro-3-deoxy-L-rhamnonate hydrolase